MPQVKSRRKVDRRNKTECRDQVIRVRLTKSELASITHRAKQSSRSVSAYLRDAALSRKISYNPPVTSLTDITEPDPRLLDIYRLVQSAGGTIRALYLSYMRYKVLHKNNEIEAVLEVLTIINNKLSDALGIDIDDRGWPVVIPPSSWWPPHKEFKEVIHEIVDSDEESPLDFDDELPDWMEGLDEETAS